MTVRLAKTLKAVSELLVVGLAIYGAGVGSVEMMTALVVAAAVVGGAEAVEAILAAQGQAQIATQEEIEEIRQQLPDNDE